MMQASDRAARMLAAREEIIERILRSAEAHALDDAELVAAGIHAVAAALIDDRTNRRSAGMSQSLGQRLQSQMKQAALVLLSLFAMKAAQAMPIISGDGTETCSLPGGATCIVQAINSADVYDSASPAVWISYANTGRPGTVTAPPGYVATFYEQFVAILGSTLNLEAWADNWVEIFIDGASVFSTTEQEMFRSGNQAALSHIFVSGGTHTLAINGYQAGSWEVAPGNPFGIMYSGTLTQVPEPAALAMFGLGLTGIGCQRRTAGRILVRHFR